MALTDEQMKERYATLTEAAAQAAAEAKSSQEPEKQNFFKGVAVGIAAAAKALEGGNDGE